MKQYCVVPITLAALSSFLPAQPAADGSVRADGAKAGASLLSGDSSPEALNDGREPKNSADSGIPRFSWNPRLGSFEWVEYVFPQPRLLQGCSVYWYDDQALIQKPASGGGGTALPDYWKVLYQNEAGDWFPADVPPPAPARDMWNVCRFSPVRAKALRLAVQLRSSVSAGLLEWKLIPAPANALPSPPPEELRLDDLIPLKAEVGYKSYRVNTHSRAEEERGARVLLDGQPCSRFLFAHADSSVSFAVPEGFSRFSAVGIAPSNRPAPSWIYQILADGKSVFRSGPLQTYPGHQVKMAVALPPGTRTLTLITDSAGSAREDHSLWANPLLLPPALSDGTRARLTRLQTQFREARAKALQPLTAGYQAALNRALETARKDFDPGAITALEEEIKNTAAGKAVPSADSADTPPVLAALRATYRGSVAAASVRGGSALRQAEERHDAALAALAESLTARPEEASAVTALRARLRAGRPPASAPVAAAPAPAPAPATPRPGAPATPRPAVPGKSAGPAAVKPAAPDPGPAAPRMSGMAQLRQLAERVISLNPAGLTLIADRKAVNQSTLPLPSGTFDITEIRLSGVVAKAFSDADLDLLGAGRSAQILHLNGTSLTRLDGVKPHAGLRWLSLIGNPLDDEALRALAGLRALQHLNLDNTRVTGRGLVHLTACPALGRLGLWATPISDESLEPLSRMKNLTAINLGLTKVTGGGLKHLAGLSKLTYLGLESCPLSPEAAATLPPLKNLRELTLSGTRLTTPILTAVGSMAGLETLLISQMRINDAPLADAEMRELAGLTRLKHLSVTFNPITGTGLAALAKARGLERLECPTMTDAGLLAVLKTFPALTTLTLGGGNTAASLASLNQASRLKDLSFSGPGLNDENFMAIPPLRALQSLNLEAPQLTSAIAAAIARQPNLLHLHLAGTSLNDDAVPALCGMKNLKELTLRGLSLSAASLEKLKKALPACRIIR